MTSTCRSRRCSTCTPGAFPGRRRSAGVKQVYPGRGDPALLVKLIKTEGVTYTHGVPTILQMLLTAAEAAKTDRGIEDGHQRLPALPKALAKQALAAGIDICAGYGMSETGHCCRWGRSGPGILSGDPDQEVEIRTRAGLAGPLVDLRIVDADMKDVPHDGKTSGEIVVRAPWLDARLSPDNPAASEQLWAGGYLHTNDIAVMTSDGYVQITDRIKDVIKTGGEWVSSLQLEDPISQCVWASPKLPSSGVKDERWGEQPLALVIKDAKTGASLSDGDIGAHLKTFAEAGVISRYGIPEKILFVEQLARTSVGKINKKALREQYGDM